MTDAMRACIVALVDKCSPIARQGKGQAPRRPLPANLAAPPTHGVTHDTAGTAPNVPAAALRTPPPTKGII